MKNRFGLVVVLTLVVLVLVPSVVMAQDDDTDANKALTLRWITELLGGGDLDVADEIISPDFFGDGVQGIDGVKEWVEVTFNEPYVDYSATPLALIAEGDYIAFLVRGGGEFVDNIEELRGTVPVHGALYFVALNIHRMANGRITEYWGMTDYFLIMQHLGYIPNEDVLDLPLAWDVALGESSTTPEENKALVMQAVEMWNTGNTDMMADIYADDFVFYQPLSINPEPLDRDATAEHIAMMHEAFAGFTMRFDLDPVELDMIAEGDLVVVPYVWEGTFVGDFGGFEANGVQVSCPGHDLVRIEDGMVAEHWHNWNTMCFVMAAMTPPEEEE